MEAKWFISSFNSHEWFQMIRSYDVIKLAQCFHAADNHCATAAAQLWYDVGTLTQHRLVSPGLPLWTSSQVFHFLFEEMFNIENINAVCRVHHGRLFQSSSAAFEKDQALFLRRSGENVFTYLCGGRNLNTKLLSINST